MKKIIICEKPSQVKDFMKAIGDNPTFKKIDAKAGYYEDSNFIFCFAAGHLLKLKDLAKEEKWNFQSLPNLFEDTNHDKIINYYEVVDNPFLLPQNMSLHMKNFELLFIVKKEFRTTKLVLKESILKGQICPRKIGG